MAGHLATMGREVTLWNRSPEHIDALVDRGAVDLEGVVEWRGAPVRATSAIGDALERADIVMVVLPAYAHREVAALIAPHTRPGQLVVLNPGRTGGALEVNQIFEHAGVHAHVTVAECQSLVYVARRVGSTTARIFEIKNSVPLAAMPASQTSAVLRALGPWFPQFVPAANVLETSFGSMGMVFHPTVAMLNTGWIESGGDFGFYTDGLSPSVARVLEALDLERRNVAAAIGAITPSAREWLSLSYGSRGGSLEAATRATPGYRHLTAPSTMTHRYLLEDVPMGLVPTSETGWQYGVVTPTIDAVIHLASAMLGCDFRAQGRTPARMGFAGLSVDALRCMVDGSTQSRRRRPAILTQPSAPIGLAP